MIEEAETSLDDKYEAMKEVNDGLKMEMNLHLLLVSHILRKHSKDNVDIVVNMAAKQAAFHERKANLENKKIEQGNLKSNQNGKPIWKQGNQNERRSLTSQRLNVSTVTNMGTLAKIAPTRKIKQI